MKNKRIVKKKCKGCGNNKMFSSRGVTKPTYNYKCNRCGEKE